MYDGNVVEGGDGGRSGNDIIVGGEGVGGIETAAASKKQNLMAFHVMDNTKLSKGFNIKEGKSCYSFKQLHLYEKH